MAVSRWQLEACSKAVRVPTNAGDVPDRAFYSAPMLLSSVCKMELFKNAMRFDKLQLQGVSSLVGGSLQNAARLVR